MAIATKARRLGVRPRTHAEINDYRRQALMEGAIRSLAEHGVAGTTVSTICAAAGSSRGLIGHYYPSKDALMAAALEHLFGQISEQVRSAMAKAGPSAVEQLNALPVALFSPAVFTDLTRTAFLSFWHETRFNPTVKKANRQLYRDYIARVEAMFRAAAAEKGIEIDALRAAQGFIGLSDGLWLGMSIHDDVITAEQVIAICHDYIAGELAG